MSEKRHVQVYALKSQRDDVLDENPNLTDKVTLPILEFDTFKDLRYATDSQIKKFVENRLKEKSTVNTKYEFNDFEDVKVVQSYDLKNPVFEGKVSIPENVVNVSRNYSNVGRVEVK